MRSNGFGRFPQRIVVHVDHNNAELVCAKLRAVPMEEGGSSGEQFSESGRTCASLTWSRLTTRPGNDEDVVYDLQIALDDSHNSFGWKIDWNASDY
jgi:hypothetical protein